VRKGEARASLERARGKLDDESRGFDHGHPFTAQGQTTVRNRKRDAPTSNGAPELPSRLKNAPTARAPGSIGSRSGCARKSRWLRSSAMRRKAWTAPAGGRGEASLRVTGKKKIPQERTCRRLCRDRAAKTTCAKGALSDQKHDKQHVQGRSQPPCSRKTSLHSCQRRRTCEDQASRLPCRRS